MNVYYNKISINIHSERGLLVSELHIIKKIEELSINAWPSYKIELYDNWLIRFSHQYTYRTNCVEQIGPSTLPLADKITYCEAIYAHYHTPTSFKINPLLPAHFDTCLTDQGYEKKHITEVMILSLDDFQPFSSIAETYDPFGKDAYLPTSVTYPDSILVQLQDTLTDRWIYDLFRLNGTTNLVHQRIVPSMFKAIPKETIVCKIERDGQMVASGLGILDRDYIGIYAIYVDSRYRGKHFARAICNTILSQAQKKGARHAYLQVVEGNTPARHLYESLGFQYFYTYWFRSKD